MAKPQLPLFRTPAGDGWRSAASAWCAHAALRLGEIPDDPSEVERAFRTCRSLTDEQLAALRAAYEQRLAAKEAAER